MDRLDKLSLLIIFILIAVIYLLSRNLPGEATDRQVAVHQGLGVMRLGSDAPEIKKLKQLIAAGNVQKAEEMVGELLRQFPYEGEPYMLKGDILMRKQETLKAMYAYREAVDLNQDYVDSKTRLFQGKKIAVVLKEAGEIIGSSQSGEDSGGEMKEARETMYYLMRKLAGSCG